MFYDHMLNGYQPDVVAIGLTVIDDHALDALDNGRRIGRPGRRMIGFTTIDHHALDAFNDRNNV